MKDWTVTDWAQQLGLSRADADYWREKYEKEHALRDKWFFIANALALVNGALVVTWLLS